jgi:hypothetical protein
MVALQIGKVFARNPISLRAECTDGYSGPSQ